MNLFPSYLALRKRSSRPSSSPHAAHEHAHVVKGHPAANDQSPFLPERGQGRPHPDVRRRVQAAEQRELDGGNLSAWVEQLDGHKDAVVKAPLLVQLGGEAGCG